jgi:hypothetical protein
MSFSYLYGSDEPFRLRPATGAPPERITPYYLFLELERMRLLITVLIRRGGAPPGAAAFIIRGRELGKPDCYSSKTE